MIHQRVVYYVKCDLCQNELTEEQHDTKDGARSEAAETACIINDCEYCKPCGEKILRGSRILDDAMTKIEQSKKG